MYLLPVGTFYMCVRFSALLPYFPINLLYSYYRCTIGRLTKYITSKKYSKIPSK